MKIFELEFCEKYEKEVNQLELLTILKDQLTESGLLLLEKTEQWCSKNMYKYCDITNKPKP